jgi:hypothetical protein
VLSFSTQLYNTGVGYSGINTARSALSLVLGPIHGMSAGKHPLVVRLVKAVWRLKPPKPRCDSIWDANLILNLFRGWDDNVNLDLVHLTLKLLGLLALVSAQRVQTISALRLSNIRGSEVKEISVDEMIKTSKHNQKQPSLFLPSFPNDPKLCVVNAINEYIRRSDSIRKDDKLFISYCLPHKAVCSQTLSRWLKCILSKANVDVSVYKGHSFRHASTSKSSDKGVDINVIFSRAGWSQGSSVFAKFYKKEIDNRGSYASAVLDML